MVYRETASPDFRYLPPEIISEIFWHAIPVWSLGASAPITSGPDREFNVLDLGAVCQSWRKIAWATPLLWTGVRLLITVARITAQRNLLEEWLLRSGDLPLDIALYCEETDEWPYRRPSTLVDVANKYSSRWRSLLLQLPECSYGALPGSHITLPILTSLRLTPHGCPESETISLEGALELREVVLDLTNIYVYSVNIPHEKITTLNLSNCFIDECLSILRVCPAIIWLTLNTFRKRSTGNLAEDLDPFIVPYLSTLKLYQVRPVAANHFFRSITSPDLSELTYDGRAAATLSGICDFISRCPKLLFFSLLARDLVPEQVTLLLKEVKTIKSLELQAANNHILDSPVNNSFLDQLRPFKWDIRPTCLLPKLEELKYIGPQSFLWSSFIAAWKARSGSHVMQESGVAEWKKWDIKITSPIRRGKTFEALEKLRRESCGRLVLRLPRDETGDQGA